MLLQPTFSTVSSTCITPCTCIHIKLAFEFFNGASFAPLPDGISGIDYERVHCCFSCTHENVIANGLSAIRNLLQVANSAGYNPARYQKLVLPTQVWAALRLFLGRSFGHALLQTVPDQNGDPQTAEDMARYMAAVKQHKLGRFFASREAPLMLFATLLQLLCVDTLAVAALKRNTTKLKTFHLRQPRLHLDDFVPLPAASQTVIPLAERILAYRNLMDPLVFSYFQC